MTISHVCNSCGVDLARATPFVDPVLNLPIVVCPGCSYAVVRRRHPLLAFWRRARRADTALSILTIQIIIALILLGTIVGMAGELALMATDRGETPLAFVLGAYGEQETVRRVGNLVYYNDDGRGVAVTVVAIVSAMAGVWLTATLAHLRFVRRWTVLIALLLGLVSTNWIAWTYGAGVAIAIGEPALAPPAEAGLWLYRVILLSGCVAVMLIASPLGLPVRWILSLLRGSMWRRQLKRARCSRGRDG